MAERIKWGILGCAQIAQNQVIPAIQSANNAEVIAVASRNEVTAKAVAERFKIPKFYGDYQKLLEDPEIDTVYIPLPNHLHVQWAIQAALSGKHVLCEKPIALNPEETKEMIKVSNENNVLLMEGFMYQFHPQWKRVLTILKTGEIGSTRMIKASFSFIFEDLENIRYNPAMGGGSLFDVGCYCVNASRLIMQDEPESVQAIAHFVENGIVDKSFIGIMKFPGNKFAYFDSSFEVADRQSFEIVGTLGSINIVFPFRPDLGEAKLIIRSETGVREEILENANMYTLQIEHLSNCILKNEQPLYSAESSLENIKLIDELYKTAKRNPIPKY